MNATEQPPIAVIFDSRGVSEPPKPKVHWWHWIAYYAYNLSRKPKVWQAQRELDALVTQVREAMAKELLPSLWQRRLVCPACRDAYMALKPQVFLSQIELILKRLYCADHREVFIDFWMKWDEKFKRSEEISAWINGFGK